MPRNVEYCWTTPYIEICGQLHLSRLSNSQHYPQGLQNVSIFLRNPSAKLEINCAFTHLPINCICNIDLLRSKFHVAILYSLLLMIFVQRVGVFGKFIQYTMHILSSIPSPCIIPSMYYESFLLIIIIWFQGRCAQVFQIYSNRYLTAPHFRGKYEPSHSIFASTITSCILNCSDKTGFQSATWCWQV